MATVEKVSVLIMFGGISPEHEVSVISGLQIVENIDRLRYSPHVLYISKKGELLYLGDIKGRKEFIKKRRDPVTFGRDIQGGYIQLSGIFGQKIYPKAAFLAFHGGLGEGGSLQGLLESVGIPFTSSSSEGSVLSMNKQITKDLVEKMGVKTIPGKCVTSEEILANGETEAKSLIKSLGLPLILKPVHLGSSIGINVAHNEVELQKYLFEAAHLDSEILVETFLSTFVEYNCSVRRINGNLETSVVERPISKDEILSFADKYKRGSKKVGGSGMASLDREIPAKISEKLRDTIQSLAKKAFVACRCKGMVRTDFIATEKGELYLVEVNPIPGSLAFYLWEPTGIQFKQQITDLLEQSLFDAKIKRDYELDYVTDIVEKFVKS